MTTSIAAEIRSNLSSIWYLSIIEKKHWVITLHNFQLGVLTNVHDNKDIRDFGPDYPNHDIIESNDSIGLFKVSFLFRFVEFCWPYQFSQFDTIMGGGGGNKRKAIKYKTKVGEKNSKKKKK